MLAERPNHSSVMREPWNLRFPGCASGKTMLKYRLTWSFHIDMEGYIMKKLPKYSLILALCLSLFFCTVCKAEVFENS